MSFQNPKTPSEIAKVLKRNKWALLKNEDWKSPSGNIHSWSVAIYLVMQGESNAKLVEVPDNKALRADKPRKPGLGHGALKKEKKPEITFASKKTGSPVDPSVTQVHQLKKEGYSLRATAKKLGIAQSTVHRLLHLP